MHGDLVAVELLPKSKWRGRGTALAEGPLDEKSGEDGESNPMPTGGEAFCLTALWVANLLTAFGPGRSHRWNPAEKMEGLRGDLPPQGWEPEPEQELPAHPGCTLGPTDPQDQDQHPAGGRSAGLSSTRFHRTKRLLPDWQASFWFWLLGPGPGVRPSFLVLVLILSYLSQRSKVMPGSLEI